MRLLPKSIHRCRRYPTKFNSGRDIPPSGQTIVKPTALGPGANTDTKLLIYGLFQKGRVLAQDGVGQLVPWIFDYYTKLGFSPAHKIHALRMVSASSALSSFFCYRGLAFRQLDSNGTARVGGGHRGVTEIVRSLESTLRCLLRLLRRFGLSFPHP